jgi:hypothetical protein
MGLAWLVGPVAGEVRMAHPEPGDREVPLDGKARVCMPRWIVA